MRILIADDEAGARRKVVRFLAAHKDCECVGEAENGRIAAARIKALQPDLVFLDINMPHLDGFEVLADLPDGCRPLVVFATAYSDRAIQAFDVSAVDYLLKPFDRQRFDNALKKARQRLPDRESDYGRVMKVLANLSGQPKYSDQILVQGETGAKVIAVKTIEYIESAGNYAVLHIQNQRHIMRYSLRRLEDMLDPKRFCRIHRQYLVRVAAIAEIQPYHKGDMVVVLNTGQTLKMSRRYKDMLMGRMIR